MKKRRNKIIAAAVMLAALLSGAVTAAAAQAEQNGLTQTEQNELTQPGQDGTGQEMRENIAQPNPQTSYASGKRHVAVRMQDGTVTTLGSNEYLQRDVDEWTDIAAVAAGATFTAGLHYDGTVSVAGFAQRQDDVERWSNITRIAAAGEYLVGLTADGEVKINRYVDKFEPVLTCQETEKVKAVMVMDQPQGPFVLLEDGRVRGWLGDYVELDLGWTDVEYITSGGGYLFGLTEKGTLRYERLFKATEAPFSGLEDFHDIVQVYASEKTCYGVRSDGKIMQAQWDPASLEYKITAEIEELENVAGIIGSGYFGRALAGVTKNGDVLPLVYNYGDGELSEMKDLSSVSFLRGELFDGFSVIGKGKDGKVHLYGTDASIEYLRLSEYLGESDYNTGIHFENIMCSHSNGSFCEEILFLDENGGVWVQTDSHGYQKISDNVRQIAGSRGLASSYIAELKNDNTIDIVYTYGELPNISEAESWTDITQVATWLSREQDSGILGLRSDGTVAGVSFHGGLESKIADWEDIEALFPGEYAVGAIRRDGTAEFIQDLEMYNFGQYNTSSWRDLKQLALGTFHTVGLKEDGTVYATGRNDFGQCEVTGWTDVTYVAAGENCTLGVREDGTLLIAGEAGWETEPRLVFAFGQNS